MSDAPSLNVPNPDPSLATNERLALAKSELEHRMERNRTEAKGWTDSLQVLLEEKITGGNEIIKTRLDGNDTALVAALQAQKEAATKQTENFTAILDESKKGTMKQIDAISDKIDDLKERMSETGGRNAGVSYTIALVVACLAAVAAIITAFITLTQHLS